MSSFLSDAAKSIIASQFNNLHDTFSRDIVVYKEAQKVVISTDPNYNYIYNQTSESTSSVTNVPQKQVFKARIRYDDNRDTEYFGEFGTSTKISRVDSGSRVRIKLKKVDYDYIRDAKRIEFDGRMFLVDSDPRPHGLFDVDFYTLYLKPVETQ
ncbi:MAG: hypothetical protein CMO74_14235 [Verrucomicrobiales bacterium]|nr:hypothetical protein [Verrucomicrobiales bacterium]|tara:strand:+ start:10651 stop:11112 length:462 start_codon:yes stop_codon:yes gene_type:complete